MHVMAGGRSYKWRNLGLVTIVRKGHYLTPPDPMVHLMICPKKGPMEFSLFATQDEELVKRIDVAINTAAEGFGIKRENRT
jgi:hypothetical protein